MCYLKFREDIFAQYHHSRAEVEVGCDQVRERKHLLKGDMTTEELELRAECLITTLKDPYLLCSVSYCVAEVLKRIVISTGGCLDCLYWWLEDGDGLAVLL